MKIILLITLLSLAISAQTRTFRDSPDILLGLKKDRTASLTFADVDGDKDLDAIVANGRHWPQINEIFLNNGRGRFTIGYTLGNLFATSYAVPAADLDGDGDQDIVVGNDNAPNMIYLNDDRLPDALVTNRGAENGIYINKGEGKFSKKRGFGTRRDSTISLAVADLNKDGRPDLILANRDGQGNVLFLNDGKMSFNKPIPYGTGSDETRAVAIADMNADGNPDIITANIGQQNGIYFGDGRGSFDLGLRFGGEEDESYALAISDIDRDGHPDIGVANSDGLNGIYINRPTGE